MSSLTTRIYDRERVGGSGNAWCARHISAFIVNVTELNLYGNRSSNLDFYRTVLINFAKVCCTIHEGYFKPFPRNYYIPTTPAVACIVFRSQIPTQLATAPVTWALHLGTSLPGRIEQRTSHATGSPLKSAAQALRKKNLERALDPGAPPDLLNQQGRKYGHCAETNPFIAYALQSSHLYRSSSYWLFAQCTRIRPH